MSYKVGDKFIIEIGERYGNRMMVTEDDLFRVKGFKSLVFDKNGLDKLQKYEEEVVATKFYEKGRKEALEEVQNCESYGYEKGLQDAWELARKISHMCLDDMNKCFDLEELDKFGGDKALYEHFTPQEALAKLEAYEESKAINER